jgi:hypothetical protein
MKVFKQRFRFQFPTKLWLVLSLGVFCYLFFKIPVEMKGNQPNQPTAYRLFLSNNSRALGSFCFLWIMVATGIATFIAAIFGALRAFFPVKAPRVAAASPSRNN